MNNDNNDNNNDNKKTFSYDEALKASLEYFEGDDFAAGAFVGKYALNKDGIYYEKTPEDMHRRMAREFARIEAKYPNPLSEEEIFSYLDHYKYIVPQGSPMSGIGNPFQITSLSNCFIKGTQVLTIDEGVKNIEDIKIGNLVPTHNHNIKPVTQVHKNPLNGRLVYKLQCYGTKDIYVTENHKFFSISNEQLIGGYAPGWNDLNYLRFNDWIAIPNFEKLNISNDNPFIDDIKLYSSSRLGIDESFKDSSIIRKINDTYFVRIHNKTPVDIDDDFVYTFGVEDDHSYCVEGLICQNCYVIPTPNDSYGGILHTDQEAAQIYKRRGGVGFDISSIRPKGLPTRNAAKTTDGIGVFMERFSRTCREVAMAGRRGANLMSICIHHPEVETFINIKQDKTKVTGANVSLRLSDEFMQAVKDDTEYEQRWPVDSENPVLRRNVRAREIWKQIIHCAWVSAEPGILFWDNAKNNTPSDIYAKFGYGSTSTNPCVGGDTLIWTYDGAITIKELAESGKDVPVYAIDPKTGNVDLKIGRNPRITGTNEKLVRILLSNNSYLDTTTNHKFCLSSGEEKQAKDLNVGDSLSSFGTDLTVSSIDLLIGKHTVYNITVDDFHTFGVVTNPDDNSGVFVHNCGEIVLSPYDSCRLIAINLYSFVEDKFTDEAYFDYNLFTHVVRKAQRLMDDLIDLEIECVDKIIQKVESDPEPDHIKSVELNLWKNIKTACINGRRTGLGITGLGDTIAALGHRYGSRESIDITEMIYKGLGVFSHVESINLAKERGAFPVFDYELEKDHKFLKNMINAIGELAGAYYVFDYQKYGRRNIANTTTAPTGTVSTQTQTTSGIEPAYLVKYDRFKKVNPGDENVRIDRVDAVGDSWQKYTVYHHGFKKWMEVTGKSDIEQSPYYKSTATDVDWVASVDIQAAAQKFLCHSVSKTCNIPNDASEELVADIYMRAWESGCKGFTVYRDGCRDGVLVKPEDDKKDNTNTVEEIKLRKAPKRPATLSSETHKMKLDTGDGLNNSYVTVSFFPDSRKPYEVFINTPVGNNIKDLQILELSARMTSLALRHGVNVQFVIDQLQKIDGQYIFSIPNSLAKALSKYVDYDSLEDIEEDDLLDTVKSLSEETHLEELSEDTIKEPLSKKGTKCPRCGAFAYVYKEGCGSCLECGYSGCS